MSTIHEIESTFEAIKKQKFFDLHKECREKKIMFNDPLFPPDRLASIFPGNKYKGEPIKWLRPGDIVKNPAFVDRGSSQFDVTQGQLNDCWLMTSMSIVAMDKSLFQRVVPAGQVMSGDRYCGLFAFNFFIFGEWIQVVVDDLLPTAKGRLIFSRSETKFEFWPALLEKAYAKLSGGFDMLQYGMTSEGFQDITGGVCEKFKWKKDIDKNLFELLVRFYLRKSLVSCFISPPDKKCITLPCKLVTMHSYGLTGIKVIRIGGKPYNLVRLKNPWNRGNGEWNGPWSNNSNEWKFVPQKVRDEIGLVMENESEFWMEFKDFINYFNVFEVCHLPMTKEVRARLDYMWNVYQFFGRWSKKDGTAGGNVGNKATFAQNPKYLLTITSDDVEEDDGLCTVVFHLEQKLYRIRKSIAEGSKLAIGMIVYFYCPLKAKDEGTENCISEIKPDALDSKFFRYNLSIARTTYQDQRILCERFRFKAGHYVVIPTFYSPGVEGDYMLRVLIARSRMDKDTYRDRFKPYDIPLSNNSNSDGGKKKKKKCKNK